MADNQVGVKTRAIIGVCRTKNNAGQQGTPVDPEIVPDQTQQQQITNTTMNQTVQLTRVDTKKLEEFVRNHSDIGLDWYVPNLVNIRVKDLIRNRVQINPGENMVVFNSTELSEFFTRSCYELDLQTGRVYTYFLPAEDIGVQCQQQKFDLALLREHFQKHVEQTETPTVKLKRIPLVKKKEPTAETMGLEETEEKMKQYCQLWEVNKKIQNLTRGSSQGLQSI